MCGESHPSSRGCRLPKTAGSSSRLVSQWSPPLSWRRTTVQLMHKQKKLTRSRKESGNGAHPCDPANRDSSWRSSDVALQPRVGLLPKRRPWARPANPDHPPVDSTNLNVSERFAPAPGARGYEFVRIAPLARRRRVDCRNAQYVCVRLKLKAVSTPEKSTMKKPD